MLMRYRVLRTGGIWIRCGPPCVFFELPSLHIAFDLQYGSQSFPIGWENPIDGFRGHVFVNPDNTTVVLSIKGTTLSGPTSKADKLNDNLMFSCCCARVDITWVFRTVCDCYAKHSRCDNACLSKSLIEDSLFYNIGLVCASISRHISLVKLTSFNRISSETSQPSSLTLTSG